MKTEEDLEDEDFDVTNESTLGKVKIDFADMDLRSWKRDLEKDIDTLEALYDLMAYVTPDKDLKLQKLIEVIENKMNNPINAGNRKVLVFSAFADTTNYLYVYVEMASMSTAQRNQGVLAYGVDPKVSMNNVVIEYTSESVHANRALMFRYGDRYGTAAGNAITTNWTNVYAITNQALVGFTNVVAENETISADGYGYTGIKKYAGIDEWKAVGNDFGAFSPTYWDTSSGAPVWKTNS